MATKLLNENDLLAEVVKAQALEPDKAVAKIIMYITEAEGVDAVEVKHGRWEKVCFEVFRCSVCSKEQFEMFNYCPNCGAKMDGDGNG